MKNEHIEKLQTRLREIFETKAKEFSRYSEENPTTAPVTAQIAGMYEDLAKVMNG
jgi:hypothetical protein